MRYLVKARLKPGKAASLLDAIKTHSLGLGSIAGDEYCRNLQHARIHPNGDILWVGVCFCDQPLDEERPYWEKYFDLISINDAHNRKNCRDLNDSEPWACSNCDCTSGLESQLKMEGESFLAYLTRFADDSIESPPP
jgi:hypothetical protein